VFKCWTDKLNRLRKKQFIRSLLKFITRKRAAWKFHMVRLLGEEEGKWTESCKIKDGIPYHNTKRPIMQCVGTPLLHSAVDWPHEVIEPVFTTTGSLDSARRSTRGRCVRHCECATGRMSLTETGFKDTASRLSHLSFQSQIVLYRVVVLQTNRSCSMKKITFHLITKRGQVYVLILCSPTTDDVITHS
jgi:hypothetical protein